VNKTAAAAQLAN